MRNTDNNYKIGDVVYAKENTKQKLIIDDYKQKIYYCIIDGQPNKKQLVYFERELLDKDLKVFTL